MKAFAVSLIISVVASKNGKKPPTPKPPVTPTDSAKSTVPPCLPCINQVIGNVTNYSFCSDGSCIPSNSTCNANATGPIYTKQSGCRPQANCAIGNNGVLSIGEIYG